MFSAFCSWQYHFMIFHESSIFPEPSFWIDSWNNHCILDGFLVHLGPFHHGRPGRPLCFLLKQCRSGRRPCAGSASPCAYVAVGPWFGRGGLELGPSSIISELFRPIFRIFAIHLFLCQSFGTSHLSSAVEVMPAWKWYILPVVESQKERDESMTKVWWKGVCQGVSDAIWKLGRASECQQAGCLKHKLAPKLIASRRRPCIFEKSNKL